MEFYLFSLISGFFNGNYRVLLDGIIGFLSNELQVPSRLI